MHSHDSSSGDRPDTDSDSNPDETGDRPTRRSFLRASIIGTALGASSLASTARAQVGGGGTESDTTRGTGAANGGARPTDGPSVGTNGRTERTGQDTVETAAETITLTGRLVQADGSPAVDDTLFASTPDGIDGGTHTDASGAFSIEVPSTVSSLLYYQLFDPDLRADTLDFQNRTLKARDGLVFMYPIPIDASTSTDLGTIQLPAGSRVDVRVVDGAGTPIPGVRVDLIEEINDDRIGWLGLRTDGDGLAEISDADYTGLELAGEVTAVVRPPDCPRFSDEQYEQTVTMNGPRTIEIEVDAGPPIDLTGRILRADGTPVRDRLIQTYAFDSYSPSVIDGTLTDSEGYFSLDLSTCTDAVQFYQILHTDPDDRNFDPPEEFVVDSTDGIPDLYGIEVTDSTDLGTITLPTADTVEVRVVDPDGNPVPDARIGVAQYNGDGFAGLDTFADDDGRLRWGGSPGIELVGDVSIEARPPEESTAFVDVPTWEDFTVSGPRSVTLTLPREKPFVADVSAVGGDVAPGGLAKVVVEVENATQQSYGEVHVSVDTSSLPDGWSIERQVPDRPSLPATWEPDFPLWYVPDFPASETFRRGLFVRVPETTSVDVAGELSVRVTDPDGSQGETLDRATATITTGDGFDPTVHGLGFENWASGDGDYPEHDHEQVTRDEVQTAVANSIVPTWQDVGADLLANQLFEAALVEVLYHQINTGSASDGHCYGMVFTARQYYDDPDSIPVSGVDRSAALTGPSPEGEDAVGTDIDFYQNVQALESDSVSAKTVLNGCSIDYTANLARITDAIDGRGTAPIGLGQSFDDDNDLHQVLGYHYEEYTKVTGSGETKAVTDVYLYDPDRSADEHWWRGNDDDEYLADTTVTFDRSGSAVTVGSPYSVFDRYLYLPDGDTIDDPVSSLGELLDVTIGACLTSTLSGIVSFAFSALTTSQQDVASAAGSDLTVEVTDPNGDPIPVMDGPHTTYEYVEADAFHYRFEAPPGDYDVELSAETEQDVTVRSRGTLRDGGSLDAEYTTTVSPDDPTELTAHVPADSSAVGTIEEAGSIPPVGDFENPPADLDGDGRYEDVNGDGVFNIVDVQALFANLDDPVVQNNPDAFDFNGDGVVNVVDVQRLFSTLSE